MGKRFEIILNPIAGAGQAQRLVDRLCRRLRGGGNAVTVFSTRSAGDARGRAASLGRDDAEAILVAGGDGTISEVIDGLASPAGPLHTGAHPPMAILPVGTENLLARVIGARPNLAQAEATLMRGRPRGFDVAELRRPPDRGDRWDAGGGPGAGLGHFVMVAGAGFDGEVVHRLALTRAGNITYADYFGPILRTLMSYAFPPLRIEADGQLLCDEPALGFIGNIPRYAWGLPICRRARFDDGLLDLVIYKCSHRRQLVLHSIRTMLSAHMNHRDVIYRQVRHAVIRSDRPVALQVDGDDGGQLPVEFRQTGEQVRLLTPPG